MDLSEMRAMSAFMLNDIIDYTLAPDSRQSLGAGFLADVRDMLADKLDARSESGPLTKEEAEELGEETLRSVVRLHPTWETHASWLVFADLGGYRTDHYDGIVRDGVAEGEEAGVAAVVNMEIARELIERLLDALSPSLTEK